MQRVSNSRTEARMHHTGWISWVPVNRIDQQTAENNSKMGGGGNHNNKKRLKGISRLYGVMFTIPGR